MKILIALDLGDCKLDDPRVIVEQYPKDGKRIELSANQLFHLPHGEMISFDEMYLKYDREDESFYEAEFHGILEK